MGVYEGVCVCVCVNIFMCAEYEYINAQRSVSGVVSQEMSTLLFVTGSLTRTLGLSTVLDWLAREP